MPKLLEGAIKNVEAFEEAADQMQALSQALQKSKFTERAIIALLHDLTHMPKKQIKQVLEGLGKLEGTMLKKQPPLIELSDAATTATDFKLDMKAVT